MESMIGGNSPKRGKSRLPAGPSSRPGYRGRGPLWHGYDSAPFALPGQSAPLGRPSLLGCAFSEQSLIRLCGTQAHEIIGMPTAKTATNSTNSTNCNQRFGEIRANSWLLLAFELHFRNSEGVGAMGDWSTGVMGHRRLSQGALPQHSDTPLLHSRSRLVGSFGHRGLGPAFQDVVDDRYEDQRDQSRSRQPADHHSCHGRLDFRALA